MEQVGTAHEGEGDEGGGNGIHEGGDPGRDDRGSPCLRRGRRREERGVILGYSARIDPAAVARQFVVNVNSPLAGQGKGLLQEFEQALASYDEVVQCRRMLGRPDYQALVAVADLETYERFMTEELMALPNLGRLESRFVMKTVKSDLTV